jgi:hypothetical protein
MQANADMRGVNDNWNESVKVMRLQVDQDKARALGVTSQSIAEATGMNFSGTTVGQFREGDKLIDIVMRPPKQDRDAITDIAGVYVTTANGQSIPLTQIAKPVMVWEPGVMWREKRNFAITVQGDVREGLQGATLTNELLPQLRKMEAGWHAAGDTGYRIEVAGAVEESSKGSAPSWPGPGAAVPDLHAAHAATAQRQPFAAGVYHRPLGIPVWRRPAAAESPLRLCGAAGRRGLDGHDSAQFGDPDRPDRERTCPRRAGLGCDCGGGRASAASHRADGGSSRAGHDSAVAQRVLGAHGRGHHGRPDRGDRADLLALPAMYAAAFRIRKDTA